MKYIYNSRWVNLLLMVTSLLIVFLVAEAVMRVVVYRKTSNRLDLAEALSKVAGGDFNRKVLKQENVGLAHVIKLSRNKKIIYELMPNIQAFYAGSWIKTSSQGFRDKEYTQEKKGGVRRILGIGDSVMFGQGATEHVIYMDLMEFTLNSTDSGDKYEVINLAVPGYNTAMEVETLRERGLPFKPDLVILGYTSNDICLPNFIGLRPDFFTLKRSYLLEWIGNRGWVLAKREFQHLPLLQAGNFEVCDEKSAPEAYKFMVGEKNIIGFLNKLKDMADENHFKVMVVYWANPVDDVKAAVSKLGFYSMSIEEQLAQYMRGKNIKNYQKSELAASETDSHPSDFTHRLIAQWIIEYMVKNKVLETLGNK